MKPREWWLDFGKRINGECVALSEPPSILNKNILVHVVEYSALEKVRKELDELKEENYNLKSELKLTQNRLWDATVFLDTMKEKLKATEIERDAEKYSSEVIAKERDELNAENESLMREIHRLNIENARLAEVEAELGHSNRELVFQDWARDHFKTTLARERKAANVLREALNDIVRESSTWDLFAQCALKEADEILEGDESE